MKTLYTLIKNNMAGKTPVVIKLVNDKRYEELLSFKNIIDNDKNSGLYKNFIVSEIVFGIIDEKIPYKDGREAAIAIGEKDSYNIQVLTKLNVVLSVIMKGRIYERKMHKKYYDEVIEDSISGLLSILDSKDVDSFGRIVYTNDIQPLFDNPVIKKSIAEKLHKLYIHFISTGHGNMVSLCRSFALKYLIDQDDTIELICDHLESSVLKVADNYNRELNDFLAARKSDTPIWYKKTVMKNHMLLYPLTKEEIENNFDIKKFVELDSPNHLVSLAIKGIFTDEMFEPRMADHISFKVHMLYSSDSYNMDEEIKENMMKYLQDPRRKGLENDYSTFFNFQYPYELYFKDNYMEVIDLIMRNEKFMKDGVLDSRIDNSIDFKELDGESIYKILKYRNFYKHLSLNTLSKILKYRTSKHTYCLGYDDYLRDSYKEDELIVFLCEIVEKLSNVAIDISTSISDERIDEILESYDYSDDYDFSEEINEMIRNVLSLQLLQKAGENMKIYSDAICEAYRAK